MSDNGMLWEKQKAHVLPYTHQAHASDPEDFSSQGRRYSIWLLYLILVFTPNPSIILSVSSWLVEST